VFALALSIAGLEALRAWGPGISNASGREEFGAGMLVGGLMVMSWLLAAAFVAFAYLCWRSHRRIGPLGHPRKTDIAVLTIGLSAAAIAIMNLSSILVEHYQNHPLE